MLGIRKYPPSTKPRLVASGPSRFSLLACFISFTMYVPGCKFCMVVPAIDLSKFYYMESQTVKGKWYRLVAIAFGASPVHVYTRRVTITRVVNI